LKFSALLKAGRFITPDYPGLKSGASGTQMSIRSSTSLGLQSGDFIFVGGHKKVCTTRKTFASNANDLHQMQNKNHPFG
jgi:hypothetical protein